MADLRVGVDRETKRQRDGEMGKWEGCGIMASNVLNCREAQPGTLKPETGRSRQRLAEMYRSRKLVGHHRKVTLAVAWL